MSPAVEDFSDTEDMLPKEISKWNSNDLMDKIEAADTEEAPGTMETLRSALWTVTLPHNVWSRMCVVCIFLGELLKEMTVDYERGTSEDRLDEVCVSHGASIKKTPSP